MKFTFKKSNFSDQPNRWYVELLDNIPVGIFRVNPEGKLIYYNHAFADIFGFDSKETLRDQGDFSIFPGGERLHDLLAESNADGGKRDQAILFKKRDGTPFWCALLMNAVYNSQGMLLFVDGMVKAIEWGLENKGTDQGQEISCPNEEDIIILLDLIGRVLDINHAGADLLGYGRASLIGSFFKDLISPICRDTFALFLSDTLERGWERKPLQIIDSRGKERHLEFQAWRVKNNGTQDLIKGIGRDVTEVLQRHEEQLNREKFRGVMEMAGGVAHWMNQPLMIVNNLLDELLSDLEPADQNYTKIVKVFQQIEKLNELSKKIRGIKKYEAIDYVDGVKIVDLNRTS